MYETAGRALLLGTNSVASATQLGGLASTVTSANLITDTSNALNGLGLKKDMTFTVDGRFDLVIPEDVRDQYAIRLNDNLTSFPGIPGDNTVNLAVRHDADGVHVSLNELNFANLTSTVLQQFDLIPSAGDDQIVLHLSHLTPNSTTSRRRSICSINGWLVRLRRSRLPAAAHIFDNENWVQAQFSASGAPETISVLQGTYSTLSVDQTGEWTARVRNGQPAVQALAQGETVSEIFNVQVTDDKGAVATQPVTVFVTGTNDAPVIAAGSTTGAVQEDNNPLVTGHLSATDVDHGATKTWSVVGGHPVNGDFVFAIDEFKVTRSGITTFDDNFSDNLPPPSAPNFSTTAVLTACLKRDAWRADAVRRVKWLCRHVWPAGAASGRRRGPQFAR